MPNGDVVNPLAPAWYDFAYSLVAIVVVLAVVVTLVSLVRRWRALSIVEAALWTAFIVFVPVFGAIAWFVVGRGATDRRWEASAVKRVIGSIR